LERVCALVARAHRDIPAHFRGTAAMFWVFQVLRDYAGTMRDVNSNYLKMLPDLLREAAVLEAAIGPIDLVFGHNDLLPANFIDDGARLWLIDWDYAGFNSPLFDLGGLAANNALSETQETTMLAGYYDRAPDAALWRKYRAMKAAAALRETLWSMVSEVFSDLDFDYPAYTASNLSTYRAAFAAFEQT
jgi:thiamine kinase-like enzyme